MPNEITINKEVILKRIEKLNEYISLTKEKYLKIPQHIIECIVGNFEEEIQFLESLLESEYFFKYQIRDFSSNDKLICQEKLIIKATSKEKAQKIFVDTIELKMSSLPTTYKALILKDVEENQNINNNFLNTIKYLKEKNIDIQLGAVQMISNEWSFYEIKNKRINFHQAVDEEFKKEILSLGFEIEIENISAGFKEKIK
jgi:hypothetical protein